MKNDIRLIYVGAFLAIGLLSVAKSYAAEDWITEEVLKQLTEIRQELKGMRAELNSLKAIVTSADNGKRGGASNVVQVKLGDKPYLGSTGAKIAIVEFSDYQCPYCTRHVKNTLPKLTENYIDTGKIQYFVSDFPLDFHSQARPAAIAARCAGDQNEKAYWDMHHAFFNGKQTFSNDSYISLAADMELDLADFKQCLSAPKMGELVDESIQYGQSIGVRGTPAFFIGNIEGGDIINPIFVSGAQSYLTFSRHLEKLLADVAAEKTLSAN